MFLRVREKFGIYNGGHRPSPSRSLLFSTSMPDFNEIIQKDPLIPVCILKKCFMMLTNMKRHSKQICWFLTWKYCTHAEGSHISLRWYWSEFPSLQHMFYYRMVPSSFSARIYRFPLNFQRQWKVLETSACCCAYRRDGWMNGWILCRMVQHEPWNQLSVSGNMGVRS